MSLPFQLWKVRLSRIWSHSHGFPLVPIRLIPGYVVSTNTVTVHGDLWTASPNVYTLPQCEGLGTRAERICQLASAVHSGQEDAGG